MALRAPSMRSVASFTAPSRRLSVVVRAEGQINPSIRKSEEKVADFIKVSELPKPKFPYCDGAHVKHNKETGDNVGPLVIDNPAPAQ
ncbi:hypothetical protein GPECTOR_31g376 [Gonium pectorale]|uniref:Iron-binding zinc finger CDGSH type domain-containing protein n=1 Tax=Gonium pectorale TaxID=33097 RepID=A0A150GDU5_GONPE|nr:hypothetical protein GPECTOR_31g376 [Gonium pectorale]|eukprot:KXZ48012.1 hypothetical protein GPECTOR_31g376 [Gonium pectorale]